MKRTFTVIIERNEGGLFGNVLELEGCHSQSDTLDELMKNIKKAIKLCLEVQAKDKINVKSGCKFVGLFLVEV